MTGNRFAQTCRNRPALDLKGALHSSIHGPASRSPPRPGDGLSKSFRKARANLPWAGQIGGNLGAWHAGRATPYKLAGLWLSETPPTHEP